MARRKSARPNTQHCGAARSRADPVLPPPQLQAASARSPSRVHGRALAGLLGGWSLLWNNITGPAMVALGGVYLNAGWRAPAYGQTKERWKRENAP